MSVVVEAHLRYIPGESIVIQWGPTRTASTAQMHVLCAMANVRNLQAGVKPPHCSFFHNATGFSNGVFKVHYWSLVEKYVQQHDEVMVFQSLPRTEKEAQKNLDLAPAKHVLYSQVFRQMTQCPLSTLVDYIGYFNLTEAMVKQLEVEFRFWDVTRLCCGSAQALENRLRLHGCPPLFEWFREENAFCDMYNLTAVDMYVTKLRNLLSKAYDPRDDFANLLDLPGNVQNGCDVQNDKVRKGKDMAGDFTTCVAYVQKTAGPSIGTAGVQAYACRNNFPECR